MSMRWTRRNWLKGLGTAGFGVGVNLLSPHPSVQAAAQAGGPGSSGSRRPPDFAFPQKNKPLPYTVRRIPYDKRHGASVWPNGARIAVIAEMALEYWDMSHPHRRQSVLSSRPGIGTARPYTYLGKTTLDARTALQYGGEIGIRRLADALKDLQIPFTIMTCGSFAEDFPEGVKALAALPNVEVMDHSYSYTISCVELTKEEQREYILMGSRILEQITGRKPVGYLSQGAAIDLNALAVLAEEGYLYNADLQDDELPYFIDISGKTIVEIPWRFAGNINDYFIMLPNPGFTLQGGLDHLKTQFDRLYANSADVPTHAIFGTHPHTAGHADNMWVCREFLKHIKSYPDVWWSTYRGVAEWWTKQYNRGYNL